MKSLALPALAAFCLSAVPAAGSTGGAGESSGHHTQRFPPGLPAAAAQRRSPPPGAGGSGAMEVHPWRDGAVYRLETAIGRVSDILLQPGETLISVAAGDTARWVIGDTVSGGGPERRTHILIKPAAPGLRTNLVIATDRRVYRLDLESGARAIAGISWTYPRHELLALERRKANLAAARPVAAGIAIERLNFNYAIEGDRPEWRPVRAFDDGVRVFIEFPPALEKGVAPPLFVVGSSGKAELVNYRLRGHYYVVDRLFSIAEFRLGEKHQQVVRIVRFDRGHRRRGRGS